MRNRQILAAAVVAVTLAAGPAFAQSSTTNHGAQTSPSPTSSGVGGMGMTAPIAPTQRADANRPSTINPVMTDNGDVRASKVIGSSVYNEKNEKIGAIDDVLLGKDNKPAQVVMSVGGVLGVGGKLVAVPYDKIQFGNTKDNSDHRVMMPGATKDTVAAMGDFKYTNG
jgi:sporulation protein YlmC with PRC-barrel domain